MREALKKWVNEQLKTRGWSMAELARRADVDPSTISRVLSDKQNPGSDFYLGVARALGVTVESIERLTKEGTIPENRLDNPSYRDLIELAQKLNDDDLADVLDYATYRFRRSQNLPL